MNITVGFPLYESFDSLDVLGPVQAFTYANMNPVLIAEKAGGVKSLEGVTIQATADFSIQQLDVLFVPGGSQLDNLIKKPMGSNPYLDFLAKQGACATLVCSVCTGALLLAAAGLLDGHTVTTHWAYKEVLRLFPVQVVDDYRRYVHTGNRVTGAGISSGIDEALYIISVLAGIGPARRAQLAMQYHPQPAFQCGDPAEPDIRDNPQLPDDIRNQWEVKGTYKAFEEWVCGRAHSAAKR